MSYHLHPDIGCTLRGNTAELTCDGAVISLSLPNTLSWKVERGSDTPGPGWFSPSFDAKNPTISLIGQGMLAEAAPFRLELQGH